MRISYSALNAFKICPLKYKYAYIDRIKTPQSKDQLFGTWAHETLKMMHTPQALPPTEKQVLDFFMARFDEKVFDSSQEAQAYLYQAVSMIKNYYAKNYPSNFNIVSLETNFTTPLRFQNDAHLISGRIDRIDKLADGSFEIIDYKTSRKMPSQKNVDEDLQLSIYNLGIINQWPSLFRVQKKPVYLSLYFLKHSEKLTSQRTFQQLVQTKDQLLSDISSIQKEFKKTNSFQPRQNALCNWCEYQNQCPLWRHKFQKEKSPDENQLQKALQEYLAIKSQEQKNKTQLASLQQIINKYCDAHNLDRVFNEQGYVSRTLQTRLNYDPEKLKLVLKPLGYWSKVLSFDQKKLNQLLSALPFSVRQQIEAASQEKQFKIIRASLS